MGRVTPETPYTPLFTALRSSRLRAWLAFLALVTVAVLFLERKLQSVDSDLLAYLREAGLLPSDTWVIAAFGGLVLLGAVATATWLRAGRRLELRCPSEGVRFVRLPWGVVSARFEVDGHKVTATRTATSVRVDCPGPLRLDRDALRQIARGPDSRPAYAAAAEAAQQLLFGEVQALEFERDQLVIVGGSAEVARLVRSAVEVAQAPTRLGLQPRTREHERGCPYCHQALDDLVEHPTVRCSGCDSLSHTECWREHGGCAVFACRKGPRPREESPRGRVTPPPTRLKS